MSYTKQTWTSGDVITAAKMNHIEDGIAAGGSSSGSAIILYPTYNSPTLSDLPNTGRPWSVDNANESGATFASATPGGTALTYTEIKNAYDSYKSGAAVFYSEYLTINQDGATDIYEKLVRITEAYCSTTEGESFSDIMYAFKCCNFKDDIIYTIIYNFTSGGLQ